MDQDYLFTLVVFHGKKIQFDMVPTSWLQFNKDTETFYTAYLPAEKNGTYKKRDLILLNDFIKNCCTPPESWQMYPVDIRGAAGRKLHLNNCDIFFYFFIIRCCAKTKFYNHNFICSLIYS